ncbi:MAG: Zn-dependent alcohol dehydrogenase [Chloroflexi bacterium]|nr:Zn-dependent alcohol dehydrogenase [Chloroflexota bacterium]
MKMHAAALHEYGQPMVVEEIEIDDPKQGEVLVKLAASGVCYSDYIFVEGKPLFESPRPIVLGDEGAGVVEKVGPGVTTVKPGDHVVMSWMYMCGQCRYCTVGRPNLCDVGRGPEIGQGYLADGTTRMHKGSTPYYHFIGISTMAEYSVASENSVIKIDSDIPLDKAALLGCAVMTGVGSVINTAKVETGASVAVFGAGGVGISAIQGAVLSGAYPIIAVDTRANKLEFAKKFGATHTVDASKTDPVQEIRNITGVGADYTFEATGNVKVMRQAFEAAGRGGKAIVIGAAGIGDEVSINALDFPFTEKSLIGSGYGSARLRVDIPRLLNLYKAGKLKLDEMVTQTYPLVDVNRAFDDLREGKNIRGVLVMD